MAKLFGKAPAAGAAKKVSNAPILPAADVLDPDNNGVLATRDQVAEAITTFAKGKELEKEGQSLMEASKPILSLFATRGFSARWAQDGVRPKSPKLCTKPDGTGTVVTMSFIDRPVNFTDDQFKELAACIGPANAEQCVERFTQYTIDGKIAGEKVKIGGVEQSFQEHIETALLKYFPEDQHEKLAAMLKPKEVFTPRKGVIDRLLDFVGRGTPKAGLKLAEALVKSRCIVAYKAGAVADE